MKEIDTETVKNAIREMLIKVTIQSFILALQNNVLLSLLFWLNIFSCRNCSASQYYGSLFTPQNIKGNCNFISMLTIITDLRFYLKIVTFLNCKIKSSKKGRNYFLNVLFIALSNCEIIT